MKRICIAGVTMLLVISGIFIYGNVRDTKTRGLTLEETEAILREYGEGNPNNLTPEQIQEVLKEYAESNPERWTKEENNEQGRVYGASGVGYVNHETGEVILYTIDSGEGR